MADVRTQAMYQLLDSGFIGLIFSCFSEDANKVSIRSLSINRLVKFNLFRKKIQLLDILIRLVESKLSLSSPLMGTPTLLLNQ